MERVSYGQTDLIGVSINDASFFRTSGSNTTAINIESFRVGNDGVSDDHPLMFPAVMLIKDQASVKNIESSAAVINVAIKGAASSSMLTSSLAGGALGALTGMIRQLQLIMMHGLTLL